MRTDSDAAALARRLRRAFEQHRSGRLDEAARDYERVLRHLPDDPRVLYGLGDIALRRYAGPRAVSYLERAARGRMASGDRLAVVEALARAHLLCGQHSRAAESYRQAIELAPHDAGLQRSLAAVLVQAGQPAEAIAVLRGAIAGHPQDAQAHVELGRLLEEAGQPAEAEQTLRRALALDPASVDAENSLANLCEAQGRIDEAVAGYQRAIARRPDIGALHSNLSNALKFQGRLAEAAESMRAALRCEPRFTRAYLSLVDLAPESIDAADLERMDELAADDSLPAQERIHLQFALGRALEVHDQHDRAFDHFEAGNRLVRATLGHDIADDEAWVEEIIATFTPQFLAAQAGGGCDSPAPIFIVGMPRSGSTLIERILAAHPRVGAGGEMEALQRTLHSLAPDRADAVRRYTQHVSAWPAAGARWRELGEAYVEAARARVAGTAHVTDKMPKNFLFVGLIALALPHARLVHSLRDPIETCLSCYRQLFDRPVHFAFDLEELGRYYRLYDRLMRHWHDVLPGRLLDVDHAALVAAPEEQIRRLLAHCGLDWQPACLHPERVAGRVRTASAVQIRRPICARAVAHRQRYADRLDVLRTALGPLAHD